MNPTSNMAKITIITPVYNEEKSLDTYYRTVTDVLINRTDCEYHVLFVDDGSSDESWRIINEICSRSPRFSGLRLSRNFGAHAAISAGLDHTDCDAVATLACDLQDPAETLLEFTEKWRAGAQIVWGHRRTRVDKGWQRVASRGFFYLVRHYAMPRGSKFTTGSFLLIDRIVVEALRQFRELNRITFALVAWTGFEQEIVYYDRQARKAGISGWTFSRMIKAMYDTFIGFSELPARAITTIGIAMWAFSICLGSYLLIVRLTGNLLPGWTSIMLMMTIFSGFLFLILGVIGEYLHRIYIEVTRRPIYLISDKSGAVSPSHPDAPPVTFIQQDEQELSPTPAGRG